MWFPPSQVVWVLLPSSCGVVAVALVIWLCTPRTASWGDILRYPALPSVFFMSAMLVIGESLLNPFVSLVPRGSILLW